MRLTAIVALNFVLVSILGAAAYAYPDWQGPFQSQCGLGLRSDSFGRGVEAAFRADGDSKYRSTFNDESCFQLGQQFVAQLMNQGQVTGRKDFECASSFNDGFNQGRRMTAISAGTPCYSLGYQAGIASGRSAAREGNSAVAGSRCVSLYRHGHDDGKNNLNVSLPDSNPDRECYQEGFFDGQSERVWP